MFPSLKNVVCKLNEAYSPFAVSDTVHVQDHRKIYSALFSFVFQMYNFYEHEAERKGKTNIPHFLIKTFLQGDKGILFIQHAEMFFASFCSVLWANETGRSCPLVEADLRS